MLPSDWDGAPVVRGDTVTLAGRYAWLTARAVQATARQLQREGVALNPEFGAVARALAQASAAWREGDTFASANVRIRDEDRPVSVGDMTAKEASGLLGVGVRAVQARAARGTLPHHRVGRALMFDPADVERALEEAR